MKSNVQLKYGNYVAFCHFHGKAVNNSGLIIKIADYICKNEEMVRKGIGKIMGGKVLELESERLERLRKETEAKAEMRGEIRGEARGEERLSILIDRLIEDGRNTEIQPAVRNAEIRKQLYKEYGI